jgi:hypothetical protein
LGGQWIRTWNCGSSQRLSLLTARGRVRLRGLYLYRTTAGRLLRSAILLMLSRQYVWRNTRDRAYHWPGSLRATGSSNSYSRFTCWGGLLMIDMCFLLSLLSLPWTRAKHFANRALPCLRGWSDPTILLGSQRLPKSGSLQPSRGFCPRPKSTIALCATSLLPITSVHRRGERNGEPHSEPCRSCAVHPVSYLLVEW